MKIILNKKILNINPEVFLRRAGYGYIEDRRRNTSSFVRRLGSGFYPRLHMYIENVSDAITFNLHLDQKQASYDGSHMHNAEYDGEVVTEEINRLKNLLRAESNQGGNLSEGNENKEDVDLLKKIGEGEYENVLLKEEKRSWWQFWKS